MCEDAFRDATGAMLISKSAVSEITDRRWGGLPVAHRPHRGMRLTTTITSDGAPELINAITACCPASIRIRCWFHRLANIRAKLPEETAKDIAA
jgi:hypothetical protein